MCPRTGVTLGKCGIDVDSLKECVCRSNGSSMAAENLTLSSVVDGVKPSCCDDSGLFAWAPEIFLSSSTRDGTLDARFNIYNRLRRQTTCFSLRLSTWFDLFVFFFVRFIFLYITFDGADGSRTGLVLRLFENFFRLRFSAANAPNPFAFTTREQEEKKTHGNHRVKNKIKKKQQKFIFYTATSIA